MAIPKSKVQGRLVVLVIGIHVCVLFDEVSDGSVSPGTAGMVQRRPALLSHAQHTQVQPHESLCGAVGASAISTMQHM